MKLINILKEIKIRNVNVYDLEKIAKEQAVQLANSIDEPEDSTTYSVPKESKQELYDIIRSKKYLREGHNYLLVGDKNNTAVAFYIDDYNNDYITWEYFL